jgi:hypothetical protein
MSPIQALAAELRTVTLFPPLWVHYCNHPRGGAPCLARTNPDRRTCPRAAEHEEAQS